MRRLDNFNEQNSSEVNTPQEAQDKKDFETSKQDYNDKFEELSQNNDVSESETKKDTKEDKSETDEKNEQSEQKDDFDKKIDSSESNDSHKSLKDKFQGALDGFAKGVALFSTATGIFGGVQEAADKPNSLDYEDLDSSYSTVSTEYPEGAAEGTDNIEIKSENSENEPTDYDRDGKYEFEDAVIDTGQTIENLGNSEDSAVTSPDEWADKAKEENESSVENETEGE